MIEHLKHIYNNKWKRDNIKTTFERNVDNYIKTEELKGNLKISYIRRHFLRPTNKEIQLYRSYVKQERKLYYDALKKLYKLHIESRTWLKIKEPVIWLKEINTGYTEKEMLNDPKVSEVMLNIKHARIYTDTVWLIGKNKRFWENVEIQQIVNKLVDIETRNRGISSMYIPKQKPTNIEPISTKIVNNITGSDASRIGLPVEQQKKEVMTESTEETTDTVVVDASIETEIEKNEKVASVINIEEPSVQWSIIDYNMLYGHHFLKLIKSYSGFDAIPKQELEIIYKELGLCNNGILLFNKIVCDAFSVSDYYIMCKVNKVKDVWNIRNLVGIFEKYGKSINDYRFPNVVVKGPLSYLSKLNEILIEYQKYHYKLLDYINPVITDIVNNEKLAKYYFGLKCINGLYYTQNANIYPDVSKMVKRFFKMHNMLKKSHSDNLEIIILFNKLVDSSMEKQYIIKINNVCLHFEYMLCVSMFNQVNNMFTQQMEAYLKVVSVWRKTVEITEKQLLNAKTNEDLVIANKNIIEKVSKYQNTDTKEVELNKIKEFARVLKRQCGDFYEMMIKVKAIVEKIIGSDDY